jgi:O-antigen/teichoic acid export membrane protein
MRVRRTADAPLGRTAKSTGRRAVVTFFDQGFSSVSNFAVGVVVARLAGPAGLGVFSLAYASWLLLASQHRSLVTDPMAIEGDARGPSSTEGIRRGLAAELILGFMAAVFFALLGTILLLCGQHLFGIALLAVAPWLPCLVIQDYWRWIGFLTGQPMKALVNDVIFDVAEIIAFLLVFVGHARGSGLVLAAWGVGGLAGALYGLGQYRPLAALSPGSSHVSTPHSVRSFFAEGVSLLRTRWVIGRWIAGNSLMNWGSSQGYIFIAGFILGPTGLGGLKAAQALVTGPSGVLIQAGGSVGLPEASRAYADRGWPGLLRVTRMVTAVSVAGSGACMITMVVAGRYLLSKVYGPQFGHLQTVAVLFGVAQTVAALGLGSILILKTTRNTHCLMYTVSMSLAVSVTGVTVLSWLYGVKGAAIAAIAVAVVGVIGVRWFQHRVYRSDKVRTGVDPGRDEDLTSSKGSESRRALDPQDQLPVLTDLEIL